MPSSFFDTNALLYLASGEPEKAGRIEELIREGGWISVQNLNETARVFRGKWRQDWQTTERFLGRCQAIFHIETLSLAVHSTGLAVAERYRIGIFDAMIVAAALHCGCDTLYSEDMHHGLVVESRLTIVNPFHA
jgi:predicted nucleic acid-binding protein